jgi:hypothetical protein
MTKSDFSKSPIVRILLAILTLLLLFCLYAVFEGLSNKIIGKTVLLIYSVIILLFALFFTYLIRSGFSRDTKWGYILIVLWYMTVFIGIIFEVLDISGVSIIFLNPLTQVIFFSAIIYIFSKSKQKEE